MPSAAERNDFTPCSVVGRSIVKMMPFSMLAVNNILAYCGSALATCSRMYAGVTVFSGSYSWYLLVEPLPFFTRKHSLDGWPTSLLCWILYSICAYATDICVVSRGIYHGYLPPVNIRGICRGIGHKYYIGGIQAPGYPKISVVYEISAHPCTLPMNTLA